MKSSSAEQAQQARDLLLNKLQTRNPVSIQKLELTDLDRNLSHRSVKEAAWKLVEEGKAQFNSTWDLEIL